MRMYDVILKKRNGGVLSDTEIAAFVRGVTDGSIPDYQTAALLMAIWFRGMDERETVTLTECMARSGDRVDLSAIPGIKVDKHSTGGVGDKTSLVVGPLVAACGVPVPKMSGRGLGHTGGTIDKLESIPGLTTDIPIPRFLDIVRQTGLAIVGQTGDLAPADKKLYALRDVTATIDNHSLIAASIMSKKLAAGADAILLDVKTGSGSFMKTVDDAVRLAKAMVAIGERMGRRTLAMITDMDRPLGRAVGNALEVQEAVATLNGRGPADFEQLCIELASGMLSLAGKGETLPDCRSQAQAALASGRGLAKLRDMVAAQGGDPAYIDHPERFPDAPLQVDVTAEADGWIAVMDTEAIGSAAVLLGAGRAKKGDAIDPCTGIVLSRKPGDAVRRGDVLAVLHAADEDSAEAASERLRQAIAIGPQAPQTRPLIVARVSRDGVEWLGSETVN